jgi:hypothetical protein
MNWILGELSLYTQFCRRSPGGGKRSIGDVKLIKKMG